MHAYMPPWCRSRVGMAVWPAAGLHGPLGLVAVATGGACGRACGHGESGRKWLSVIVDRFPVRVSVNLPHHIGTMAILGHRGNKQRRWFTGTPPSDSRTQLALHPCSAPATEFAPRHAYSTFVRCGRHGLHALRADDAVTMLALLDTVPSKHLRQT